MKAAPGIIDLKRSIDKGSYKFLNAKSFCFLSTMERSEKQSKQT